MAFSCGPYGTVLADGSEYNGNYAESVTEEELIAFHRRRLQVWQHLQSHLHLHLLLNVQCSQERQSSNMIFCHIKRLIAFAVQHLAVR